MSHWLSLLLVVVVDWWRDENTADFQDLDTWVAGTRSMSGTCERIASNMSPLNGASWSSTTSTSTSLQFSVAIYFLNVGRWFKEEFMSSRRAIDAALNFD